MSRSWVEHQVINQEGERTHTRPRDLDTRKKAEKWAQYLLEASNNPEASYTIIEKRCREIITIGPKENG